MTVEFTEYHTRLAAYALIVDDQDRALLAWWNGEGHSAPAWSLPGGGIEFEESIRDGLVREVYEETGYHVAPGPLLVDDFFTAVGTANMDNRSFRLNFEVTAILYGAVHAKELADQFKKDLRESKEIKAHSRKDLPLRWRLAEAGARVLSPLL